ncbi:MAG TPA: hypothetical protein VGQ42_17920 [Candidatus Dormibacteraeota bacterium]|jgi:hypothetical protein|nr:hypothetical protein [Candidatus Dormibacteraeota bacterium]
MSTERTLLHDYLAHREELARRLTVADRVVRNVEARTLDRAPRGVGRGRMLFAVAAATAVLLAGIGLPRLLVHGGSPNGYPAGPPRGVPNTRPPADIPLIWVPDATNRMRAIALTQTGRPVGWLAVSFLMPGESVRQSGDGQRILTGDGETYELTAQGQRIDLPPNSRHINSNTYQPYPLYFSDDDRTLCLEQGPTGTPRDLLLVDGAGHVSASFAEAPPDSPSHLSWHTVTCSVRNDVAVLIGNPDPQPASGPEKPPATPTPAPPGSHSGVASVGGSVSVGISRPRVPSGGPYHMIRVIRLSTGKEIARRVYSTQSPTPIDASNDGTLVLEASGSSGYELRGIAGGALQGALQGNARGLMRNTWALLEESPRPSVSRTHMVVDVPTGRVVWSGTTAPLSAVSYPDGSMALTVEWNRNVCPATETVTITDLATGVTHRSTLDTCASG